MFREGRYQEAANEFRNALRGDQPTVVWAHISLGKIFDLTGERDRAVSQYQPALETNDDTNGALAEASRYLKTPYKPGD